MGRWIYVIAIGAMAAGIGLGFQGSGIPRLDAMQQSSIRVGSSEATQKRTYRHRGYGGVILIGGGGGSRRAGRYSGGGGFGFGGK